MTGNYIDAHLGLDGKLTATFSINEKVEAIEQLNNMPKDKLMSIEVKPYRKKRSTDANALLWACIGDIARALKTDTWSTYLGLLKRYGVYTYILVKENAVDKVKASWRECEVVGEIDVHGRKSIQMICFFGSSTYDTKEFSDLLEGTISDMKDLGLQPPTSKEMRRSLELWQKQLDKRSAKESSNTSSDSEA